MDRFRSRYGTKLVTNNTGRNLYLHKFIPRTRASESHHYHEITRNRNNHSFKQRIQSVVAGLIGVFLLPLNALADVGGVSATSNPVANSSGSATVNAYQVLTGNFINSTFGQNGVVCQAETMTLSPYVGLSHNIKRPFAESYKENVYDMRADDAGNLLDPGGILFQKDVLTQQKDNHGLNYGLTIQWSKPLDSKLQGLCKEAASTEIALRKAELNLKVLDYEISRLKHCGTLKQSGIFHSKTSQYFPVCSDIMVTNFPSSVPDHAHKINVTKVVATKEPVQNQSSNIDTTDKLDASTSSKPSVLIDVHERKAPWASSLDD
jgi:hypothetical protein